jgi:hypothetical protein
VATKALVLGEQLKATLGIDVIEAVKAKLGPAAVVAPPRPIPPPAVAPKG